MTTRISTFSAHSMYTSNMLMIQRRMDAAQMQVNTEQKSQTYAGLGNTSFRLVNMETQRSDAEHFLQTNTALELRLKVMQTSMDAMRDVTREFRNKLKDFRQNNMGVPTQTEIDDIQRWAFRAMEEMEDYLNTQVDGQFIYSGSKTQTRPVSLGHNSLSSFQAAYTGVAGSDYPDTRAEHVAPGTGYYSGDNQKLKYRVDDDREIEMGVTAIDPAFEKALRAMGLIAQGTFGQPGGLDENMTTAAPGQTRVDEALWLLADALEANLSTRASPLGNTEDSSDFESIQRITGFHQVIVDRTMKQHKTYIGFLDIQCDAIEKVDMADAIVRMQDEMRALEASYASISKVQSLSLVNYLR